MKNATPSAEGFAVIHVDGREGYFKNFVGHYATLEEAIQARNRFFGKFRKYNGSTLKAFLKEERLTGNEMSLNDGYNEVLVTKA